MVKVIVKPNEKTQEALRRFKKIREKEGITKQVRSAYVFEKPSDVRRRREEERLKTIRQAQNAAGDLAKN